MKLYPQLHAHGTTCSWNYMLMELHAHGTTCSWNYNDVMMVKFGPFLPVHQ